MGMMQANLIAENEIGQNAVEERREHPRRRTLLSGKVVFNNRSGALNCTVKDLSECGARIQLGGWLNLPREFEIHLDRGAMFRCEMVRFIDTFMSVRFIETLAQAADGVVDRVQNYT